MKRLKPFDKYALYKRAVQSPDVDCEFIRYAYKDIKKRPPRSLREDFCGTFAICCEWVKQHRENRAHGIDLDPEPLAYGREHYLSQLKPDQIKRLKLHHGSVLTSQLPKVDIVVAMNFSYYLFKSRLLLRQYFTRARKGLNSRGIFIVDCFGGSACYEPNMEKAKFPGFEYFWDQEGFDPITNEAMFHIHFKRKGEARRNKVFSYDWRMWSIPEIKETMLEAGFRHTHVYWEGTTRAGNGDGDFKRREKGEYADSWIAYIVGEL